MKLSRILMLALLLAVAINCSKNSDDGGTNNPPPNNVDKSANLKGTGDSANDILSNENFTKLLIEVGHVQGFRPTQEAMDNFTTFLRDKTFKQDIEVVYKELSSPGKDSLGLQEIADLEEDNRTAYNNGETLAIYIYFADAPSEDDDEEEGLVTLGAVYRNTSMVIYEKTIRDLAARSAFISNADVETATLNHEFGHLFGLVDLGTPEINPHEDPDAKNHCDVQGCLMRAELQFGGPAAKSLALEDKDGLKAACSLSGASVMKLLQEKSARGVATVDLDSECILDLQGNGGR